MTEKQVREFLSLAGGYGASVPDFAVEALSLFNLLKNSPELNGMKSRRKISLA